MIRLGAGLLVALGVAHAQEPAYPQEDFTLRVDVPVVSLDVSITDETGRPVGGLGPDDFEVYENDVRQQIRYFGSSAAPYHVYLLFDSSGSTRHKWGFMRRAVAAFVGDIKPQDRISIGIFDTRAKTLSEWDAPREESLRALDPLVEHRDSGGTTEFYKSVDKVLDDAFDGVRERRALVVLTDGRDTSLYRDVVRHNRLTEPEDDRRFRALRKRAVRSGIPIYFIAVNTDRNLESNTRGADEYRNLQIIYKDSPMPRAYLAEVRRRMELLAEESGGQVLFPKTLNDVVPLFEHIGRALGSAYSLGYVPPAANGEKGLRRIHVKVKNAAYRVRQSRAGYYVR